MKWANNLKLFVKTGNLGECPYCKSDNVDYALNIVNQKELMGYGAIWCNRCKRGYHLSRMKVDRNYVKPIPSDIKYE